MQNSLFCVIKETRTEALLGGGGRRMDVPRQNFNPCHVAISEGSHVAVGISWNIGMSLLELRLILL